MKRKLISFVTGAVMLLSALPAAPSVTVSAADITILNADFNDGGLDGFEVYDLNAGDNPTIANEDGAVKFYEGSGWNSTNGVKRDITQALADAGFKSGGTLSVSLDFSCSWYNNPAQVFIEVNGVKTQLASEGPGGETWTKITLTGSAAVTYNAGDSVYFCVTQPTGTHLYDNVVISYQSGGEAATQTPAATSAPTKTPTETVAPTQRPSQAPKPEGGELFSYSGDDFKDSGVLGRFSGYDKTDTGITIEANNSMLTFSTMTSSTNKNGFRMDITDFVKSTGSGHYYSASLDLRSTWWDGNAGTLAVEVVTNGSASETVLEKKAGESTSERYIFSGGDYIFFDDFSQVNLVYYQLAGMHEYYSIALSCDTSKTATQPPTAVPTASPTPKPTADPNAIVNDSFSDSSALSLYDGYSASNTDDALALDNGKLKYTAGNDYDASNGIRRDVTSEIQSCGSGTNFVVSLDMNAWWGSGEVYEHPASVFFEIVGEDGAATQKTVVTGPDENDAYVGSDVYLRGNTVLSFNAADKIYLCVTQPSGTHFYDNIIISAESPYEDGIVQLTSGKVNTGSYMPSSAKRIYIDTFDSEAELAKYTPYSTAFKTDPTIDGGMANFSYDSDWNAENGVSVNVTDAMREGYKGGDFRVALDFRTFYWGGSSVNVSLRYGSDAKGWKSYDAASGLDTDTSNMIHVSGIVAEDDLTAYDPGTDEMIINITQGAGGWLIDNVAIEIPYTSAKVYDTAVSDWSQLDSVKTVSVLYGGSFIEETDVVWDTPPEDDNVVYGATSTEGLRARAVRASTAKKLTFTASGAAVEDFALEYGHQSPAAGDNEMVFLVDSLTSMNLLSGISAAGSYAEAVSGETDVERAMKITDNGSGVTAEGTIADYAGNNECIVVFDESGTPVSAVHIAIGADGAYSVPLTAVGIGSYRAVMTDTGAASDFSYADAASFAELVARVKNGESVSSLIGGQDKAANRVIIGAEYFDVYDGLTAQAQSAVCGEFKNMLLENGKTRAQAAADFDLLVVLNSAASSLSADEWKTLITDNAKSLGVSELEAFKTFTDAEDKLVSSVKSKLSQKDVSADSFKNDFAACVINAAISDAAHFSTVLDILKANASVIGVSASALNTDTAKYVQANINDTMTTIDALKTLVNAGISKSSSNNTSGGSGGGGGGGSSSSGSSGGGTVAVGASANTLATQTQAPVYDTAAENTEFKDMSQAPWAADAVSVLASRGILNGYEDNTFRPQNNVTREEFVKLVVTALGITEKGDMEFTDIDPSRWSYDYIAIGVKAGIINGMPDGSFAPENPITRQDAAVMIYRAFAIGPAEEISGFDDAGYIADYAEAAVAALSENGIINGRENNMFAPLDNTTRAEAAVIIHRALNWK